MKNEKVYMWLSVAVMVLLLVAEAMTAIAILRMDMLPGGYAAVLIAFFVFFALAEGLLLFLPGKGKKISVWRRVLVSFMALLVICGCAVVTKVVSEAHNTIIEVTTTPPVTTNARNMYVLVRADDRAVALSDTGEYTFACLKDYDVEHTQKAIEMIGEQLGITLSASEYETAAELANALYVGDTDAVIMNGVAIAILTEEEEYEDFLENVKILLTIPLSDLEEPEETEPTVETEPADPEKNIANTPFVVYVSGSDTRSMKLDISRSDVNILAVVNPNTKQILLINTPRDSYVPNPAGNGRYDKLTHCGIYGVDCSMEALAGLYDLNVKYYGQINFTGFKTLVDAVGGITVFSEQAFRAGTTYIEKGYNNLDGKAALAFARERYRVSGGDNGRGKNQMKVITAVVEKLTSGTTIISKYTSIMNSLEGMFSTNVTNEEISLLVKMQLKDMSGWKILNYAVTGSGGSEKTYSMPGSYAYVMYLNEKSVEKASSLAQRIMDGEKLTADDLKN